MTPADKPHGLMTLGDNPALLSEVRVIVKGAIAGGEFPGRRGIPDGTEAIVWFGRANAPVAFATFFDGGHRRVWLDIVYVRPAFRRKGYGAALIAAVERSARAIGAYDQVVFGTSFDNAVMRAIGAKAGFAEAYVDLVKELKPADPSSLTDTLERIGGRLR